jgi:hypothetical protein
MLLGLLLAAVSGAFSWTVSGETDLWGLVAVAGFVIALAMKVQILTTRVDRAWYEARAAAESVKTMAWRYAVGADPFPKEQDAQVTDELFSNRLRDVLTDLESVSLVHPTIAHEQLTAEMKTIRAQPLTERRSIYRTQRVIDQQHWYVHKAKSHDLNARVWSFVMLACELAGAGGALAKATGVFDFDLLGVAAAGAAAVVAWEQVRQDSTLAKAYSIAAQELSAIELLLTHQESEPAWAKFVASSEEAISREHTLWRASRV